MLLWVVAHKPHKPSWGGQPQAAGQGSWVKSVPGSGSLAARGLWFSLLVVKSMFHLEVIKQEHVNRSSSLELPPLPPSSSTRRQHQPSAGRGPRQSPQFRQWSFPVKRLPCTARQGGYRCDGRLPWAKEMAQLETCLPWKLRT